MRAETAARRLIALLLPAAVLIAAFGLRFHRLGAQSFWNDEGSSYVQATRTLADIAYHAGRDIHPPGYYWLLAGWRVLVGETEFALRMLSALAGGLTVAIAYALGRRLYGRIAGLSAALFVGLNTFGIYYSQEARMYALLALLSALSMWLWTGLLRAGGRRALRWGLLLGVINAAGLYTQYAFVYVLAAQAVLGVAALARRRRGDDIGALVRALATSVGVTAILFLPWLPTALAQITTWPSTGGATPALEAFSVIMNWLALGLTAQNASLAVVWLLLLFGLLRLRAADDGPLLPVAWMGVSVAVFLAQDLFRESNLKFLLPAQVGLALWLGRGVSVIWHLGAVSRVWGRSPAWPPIIPRLAAGAAALSLLLALGPGIAPLYSDPAFQRDDYRAMAALIEREATPGALVILNGPNQAEAFGYYYDGDAEVIGLPPGLGGDDAATSELLLARLAARYGTTDQPYYSVFALFWGEGERDPNRVVERELGWYTHHLSDTWYGDVRLTRYLLAGTRPGVFIDISTVLTDGTDDILLLDARYRAAVEPGGFLLVELTWLNQREMPIQRRCKVFVQLLDPSGMLVAQHDAEPAGNTLPTVDWPLGVGITDRHALPLPPDLPPGEYTLIAGLYAYDPPHERLRLRDGAGDYVILARLNIE